MSRLKSHPESHAVDRIGWLRAAVLGANDGIVSTASLIVGIAAASGGRAETLIAAMAGLVAGAMSMAAGEYVSVSSQSDSEKSDLAREAQELAADPQAEHEELAAIYVARGLAPDLADEVARQLMTTNALEAHARDELHISSVTAARPVQAALTSAATFAVGAVLPILVVVLFPHEAVIWAVSTAAILFLAVLGAVGARAGKAKVGTAVMRVTFWGAMALAATALVGRLFGAVV